jgi:hypothetical protein
MAALTYTVLAQDVTRWATLDAIKSTLQVDGIKILNITVDPLIDPTVINPGAAYQIT